MIIINKIDKKREIIEFVTDNDLTLIVNEGIDNYSAFIQEVEMLHPYIDIYGIRRGNLVYVKPIGYCDTVAGAINELVRLLNNFEHTLVINKETIRDSERKVFVYSGNWLKYKEN